jgi:hypothetical protein
MESQNEIYKTIHEFENYEISNLGKVKNRFTGRILKPLLSNTGYYVVNLYNPDNSKKIPIHQLVAKQFLEKNENENIIQHIDKNLLNNCENNLRYVSKRGQNTTVMNDDTQHKNNENKEKINGIKFNEKYNKWNAFIFKNKQFISLGYYKTIDQAIIARKKAEKELYNN